jgi:hypothetical protein
MSEIKRYRMDLYEGESSNKGAWVRYEDHVAAIKAAVLAERVRCLDIVEKIHGCAVGVDGYLYLMQSGELVSRSRVETAIRWVKVK